MADNRVELLIKLNGDKAAIQALRDIQNLVSGLNGKNITLNFGNATTQAYSLRDAIAAVGNTISSIGSGMNIVGGTLTSLGDMFGGDILSVAGRTLISKATSLVTQGISKSVSRFDTFRTFPKLLEMMGFGAEDAQEALDKLNESVLGLPTSLDEMAEMSKSFIMFYGDIEKGTDLAIAANNAFLANASDATQVTFGLRQIRDILSRGGLRELEWESLLGALGTSLGPIAEQFGYTADQIGEFREALKTGDIDAMDFIDALIKAGSPGGVLAERANLLKDTLNAATTNIKIAFANLGASILQELDAVLDDQTGRNLVEHLVGISDAIKQQLIPAVREWIQSHPEDVVEFFEGLANFDWLKLLSSLGHGAYKYFTGLRDMFRWLVDTFGEDNVIKFITFATIFASPLGRALQLISRPISLLGHTITSLSRLSFGGVFSLTRRGNVIVQLAQTFADVFKVLTGAAGFVGIMYLFGQVVREYIGIAEEIGAANFGNLSGNLPILGDLMLKIGMIVGGMVTLFGAINALGGGKSLLLGELETAGFLGLIGFTGLIMDQLADLMVKIGGMDLGNYAANMQAVKDLFTILFADTGLMITLTSFLTALGGGPIIGIGEALVGGLLLEVDYVIHIISKLVELIGDISDIKVPSDAKINDLRHAIGEIAKIFRETSFDSNMSIGQIINMSVLAFGLSAFYDVLDVFDKITKKDINKDAIIGKLSVLQEVIDSLNDLAGIITQDGDVLASLEDKIINDMRVGILLDYMAFLGEFYLIIEEIQYVDPEKAGALGMDNDPFMEKIDKLNELTDGLNDMASHIGTTAGVWDTLCLAIQDMLRVSILNSYRDMLKTYTEIIDEIENLDPSKAGAYGMNGNPFINLEYGDTRMTWDDPLTLKMEQLKEIGQELQDLSISLSGDANNWELLHANINVLLTNGLLASYNGILETFNTVIDTIMGIDPTKAGAMGNGQPFIDLTEGNGEVTTIWNDPFTEKMDQLTEIGVQLKDLANDIADFDSWWGGISEVIQAHCQNVILALQGEEIQLIQDLAVAISELDLSMVEGLDDDKSVGFTAKMTTIRNMLIGLNTALQPLDSYWGPLGTAIASWNEFWMDQKLENMVSATGNLDKFLKNMRSALGSHDWIQGTSEEQFEDFITNATTAIERMDELLDSENLKRLFSLVTGNNEITYSSFAQALSGYNSIISGIRHFIMLMHFDENVNPAQTVDDFIGAVGKIGDLITQINTMSDLMDGFSGEEGGGAKLGSILETLVGSFGGEDADEALELIDGLGPLLSVIGEVITTMAETDLTDLNAALAELVAYVVELNDPDLPTLQNNVDWVQGSIIALKDAVETINTSMQVFIGTVNTLATTMMTAATNAYVLANAIESIPESKTITVTADFSGYSGTFETPGLAPFVGGSVPTLLASGGPIDWRPRGTDSVPAMLTPGEYVLNKRAAQSLGRQVLDKINNLNIPGAIDAVMSGLNLPTSASVVAYDNSRTYDNHATVNQNIYTNNAAFTYRRASRFVGAL